MLCCSYSYSRLISFWHVGRSHDSSAVFFGRPNIGHSLVSLLLCMVLAFAIAVNVQYATGVIVTIFTDSIQFQIPFHSNCPHLAARAV